MLDFLCLFWIEMARTQRTAQLIEILREPEHHRFSCFWLRMCVRVRLLSERVDQFLHALLRFEISQLARPLFYLPLELCKLHARCVDYGEACCSPIQPAFGPIVQRN